MIFNSAVFLVFIALFFAFWPLARRQNNSRWIYITAASFIFYGWWDWRFLFLLLFSGLVDYFTAIAMDGWPAFKKWFLYLSLAGNLGSLFIFKYSGFAAHELEYLFGMAGVQLSLYNHIPPFALILPVGISFYTFQSLNYTIDVYHGEIKATKNAFHFFAYLSLFPHLVAGPILRARQMLPQMMELHLPTEEEQWDGMKMIAGGFFKKMVIADNLAPFVNAAFSNQFQAPDTFYSWMVSIFFALQIYYDFSGYSDIAIGLLRWMGYYVPPNFNHPYSATSLREFWHRWNISLSSWFNDYVFTPLAITWRDGGKMAIACAIFITFSLSGLWHGAAVTFIIWGCLHGLFLGAELITAWPKKLKKLPLGNVFANVFTVMQVLVAQVFFRSTDVHQALIMLGNMFFPHFSGSFHLGAEHLLLLCFAILPELSYRLGLNLKLQSLKSLSFYRYTELAGVIILLVLCVYFRGPGVQFIYFQF